MGRRSIAAERLRKIASKQLNAFLTRTRARVRSSPPVSSFKRRPVRLFGLAAKDLPPNMTPSRSQEGKVRGACVARSPHQARP